MNAGSLCPRSRPKSTAAAFPGRSGSSSYGPLAARRIVAYRLLAAPCCAMLPGLWRKLPVARGWRAERDAALAANAALRKELDGLRQEHASLKRQNLSLNKRLLANAHCGEGGDPLHEQMRRQTESLLGEKSALARECDALKRECVSLQARSISHWFPYDRVGVVNAVP